MHLVVVADACRDRTAQVARRGGAAVVTIDARSVGAARAAGVREVLRRTGHLDPADVWLATTDADTLVPALLAARSRSRYASQGWDAVVGTVQVADWSGHPPGTRSLFRERYDRGTRAATSTCTAPTSASARLGLPGRGRVPCRAHGGGPRAGRGADRGRQPGPAHPRAARGHLGRRDSRAPRGFGDYLAGLDAEADTAPA